MFISFIFLFLMIIIAYKVIKENPPDFFSDNFGEKKKKNSQKNNAKSFSQKISTSANAPTYPLVYESFVQNKQNRVSID